MFLMNGNAGSKDQVVYVYSYFLCSYEGCVPCTKIVKLIRNKFIVESLRMRDIQCNFRIKMFVTEIMFLHYYCSEIIKK